MAGRLVLECVCGPLRCLAVYDSAHHANCCRYADTDQMLLRLEEASVPLAQSDDEVAPVAEQR